MELEAEKQKMQPEIQKGVCGKGVKSMEKRNTELEQIPSLGSDAPCHLSKAVTICIPISETGLGASPQMAA